MGIWTDIDVRESHAKNYELSLTSTFNYDWKMKREPRIKKTTYEWSVKRGFGSSGEHSLELDFGNPSTLEMYFMFRSTGDDLWGKSPMFDVILSDNPALKGEPVFIDMEEDSVQLLSFNTTE